MGLVIQRIRMRPLAVTKEASDADPSECIDRTVKIYLITPTAPFAGNVCQPDHDPFDPNFGKPPSWEQHLFE